MFNSAAHIHVPRGVGRNTALRTFIASSSFGPPDTKAPLRRGILLTAIAFVFLLLGSILTWLGSMSMTGPLLIAMSLLMLLLSFRQFVLARKYNATNRPAVQLNSVHGDTVTAVVVNHDDGLHPATIIVDRYNRLGYDPTVTVHRPLNGDNDCAPPSYHEVTRQGTNSNVVTHEAPDELPPTYEETMGSLVYPVQALPSSIIPSYSHAVGLSRAKTTGEGMSARAEGGESAASRHSGPIAGRPPHYSRSQKPLALVAPRLEGEAAGLSQGCVAQSASHNLTLPALHLSAPTSPRQLSAPPSPHPFSAPPSPRQLSPHQPMSVSLQYVAGSHSPHLPPCGYHTVPAPPPPSPHALHSLASPHTSSAPSSPRPFSGQHSLTPPPQHSLTPPPQYTSAPPSPRQFSAPASPLMVHGARSPGFLPPHSPLPMHHPVAFQPTPQQFPACSLLSGQNSASSHQYGSPVSIGSQAWASQPPPLPPHRPPSRTGGRQEGYTCFTYNFVTPLPVETSSIPSTNFILGTPSSSSTYPTPSIPGHTPTSAFSSSNAADGRPVSQLEPVSLQGGAQGGPLFGTNADSQTSGGASAQARTFSSITDIQANI